MELGGYGFRFSVAEEVFEEEAGEALFGVVTTEADHAFRTFQLCLQNLNSNVRCVRAALSVKSTKPCKMDSCAKYALSFH